MLPGTLIDQEKDKKMRAIPPMQLSSKDNIINIHETKNFQDKHNKLPGVDKYGLANLSKVEETKNDDTIEDIPAFRQHHIASDKEALEDL